MRTYVVLLSIIAILEVAPCPTFGQDDICERIFSFDDVMSAQPDTHGFLEKMSVDRRIDKLNLPQTVKNNIKAFGPFSVQMHLLRVVRNEASEAERSFGLALLASYSEIEKSYAHDYSGWAFARDCIGSEVENTPVWWTFAPYIFKHLKLMGISDYDAVEKLVSWASAGKMRFGEEYSSVTLPGMDFLNDRKYFGRNTYVLDLNDSNHVTHKFTDQQASRIVKSEPFFK